MLPGTKIVRLTRLEQRALEDLLQEQWEVLMKNRFTMEQMALWVKEQLKLPGISKNHIMGAIRAIGKTAPRHRENKYRTTRPVLILLGDAVFYLASKIPGASSDPTITALRTEIDFLLEKETKPQGGER